MEIIIDTLVTCNCCKLKVIWLAKKQWNGKIMSMAYSRITTCEQNSCHLTFSDELFHKYNLKIMSIVIKYILVNSALRENILVAMLYNNTKKAYTWK